MNNKLHSPDQLHSPDTLYSLLSHLQWSEVAFALRRYFREGARDLEPFCRAFERLRRTVPEETSYRLVLRRRPANPDEPWQRERPAEVGCTKEAGHGLPRDESFWSLEFRCWEECLGMGVPMAARIAYMDAGVMAHCLWEMTRHGLEDCDPLDLLVNPKTRQPDTDEIDG
jgi:hypothetical protein